MTTGESPVSKRRDVDVIEAVRNAWTEYLCVSTLNEEDNFFATGGNSLVAARMMAELSERLEHPLGLRLLTKNPTFGQLSEAVRDTVVSSPVLVDDLVVLPHD